MFHPGPLCSPSQWLSLRLSCLRVGVYSAEEASTERNSFTPGPLGAVPGLFMIVDTPGAASEQALPWHGHLTGGKAARLGHLQLGWGTWASCLGTVGTAARLSLHPVSTKTLFSPQRG